MSLQPAPKIEVMFVGPDNKQMSPRWSIWFDKLVQFLTVPLVTYIDLDVLSAAPPVKEGRVYYNSTTKKAYCYNGTSWNALF